MPLRLEFISFCLKLFGFGAEVLGFGGMCCNYLFGFRVGVHTFLRSGAGGAVFKSVVANAYGEAIEETGADAGGDGDAERPSAKNAATYWR